MVAGKAYIFLLLAIPTMSMGGDFESKVEYVQVNLETNSAAVKFVVNPTNPPPCATQTRMAIPLDTDGGKAAYSLILSAQASDRIVFGKGKNDGNACDVLSGMDTVRYIRLL